MGPTILVLWTGYPNGARICRSLRRAGFTVVGAFPRGRAGGRSMACPRPLRYPSPVDAPEGFLAWVTATCRRLGVDAVLPVDEDIVRILAEHDGALGRTRVVGPDLAQYRALCDKRALADTARSLGLDSPLTVEVDGDGHSDTWPPLPSIVKPRTSGSEVDAPSMVDTAEQRDALVRRLVDSGHGAVVQECITGPRWVVHSVRGEGVFEHVIHRVELEWPRGCGLATQKRPSVEPVAVAEAARRLLDHVDYRGPSGISFLEQDGRFYPHDVNLRLGATTAASINCGFDFPRRAVEAVLGIPGEPFDGRFVPDAVHMRLDVEIGALASAVRRRDRGDALTVLRQMARVGMSRRGMLDPSPLNPLWAVPMALSMLGVGRRRAARGRRPRPYAGPERRLDQARSPAAASPQHRDLSTVTGVAERITKEVR